VIWSRNHRSEPLAHIKIVARALLVGLAALALSVPPSAAAQNVVDAPGTGGLVLLTRSLQTTDSFELEVQLPGVIQDDDLLVVAVYPKVTNRQAFRATLAGRRLGTPIDTRITALSQLNANIRGRVRLSVGAETIQALLVEPGVYPVTVELRTSEQLRLGRLITHLVRVVEPISNPTKVALALVMEVRPQRSLATQEIVDDDTTAQWMDLLIERTDLPVTVQPSPFLFDQFQTDPRMRAFVERLATAEVIAGPYVPVNELSLDLAGLEDRATELFARGAIKLADAVGSDPITTRWLSRTEPDQDTADLWHDRGVRDVVVADGRGDLDGPVEITTSQGTLRTLVSPGWFGDADPMNTTLGAHQLLAELAVIAMTSDHETSSVLLFDSGAPFNRRFMDELIDGIMMSQTIEPVSLSEAMAVPQLVNNAAQPVSLRSIQPRTQTPNDDFQLYLRAVAELESYRSMIGDEDSSRVYDIVNENLLLSLGTGITDAQRDIAASAAIDKIRAEVERVDPPPIGGVSLTSREATAPFSFRNRNDYPLRVEVRFLADKARFVDFDDGETTTIVLEPGITTKEFRVQALAAGSFPLRIEMFSPDGALALGAVDLTMRSTAPSFVGVAVTGVAAFVLVVWWGRDLIRGRRRKHL